uniref:SERF-like protein n=1 Tax=Lepeophtheirus salmonis TaxID=72036 RepID=C1BT43_LEPSM|nr:SERF-like protein [Lepeophtheirus salmonis]
MTRGNQRDLVRAKAMKKEKSGKSASDQDGNKGLTLEQRKQRDADRMREKQLKKIQDKEAGGGGGGGGNK